MAILLGASTTPTKLKQIPIKHKHAASSIYSYLVYFLSQAQENQKKFTRKKLFVFLVMELSSPNIKKILIFSQKKAFLIFPQMKPCTF